MKSRAEKLRNAVAGSQRPRWSAVWLIYMREMRDQLRDRRTLFTIAVLPMMLYPLVGMLLLQIAQFTRQHPTNVCIIGTEHLEKVPPLLDDSGKAFLKGLTDGDETLDMVAYPWDKWPDDQAVRDGARQWVQSGVFDAVAIFPPEFANEKTRATGESGAIELLYNIGSDQSMVAQQRMTNVISVWRSQWVRNQLADEGIDLAMLEPFQLQSSDIAPKRTREAAFWSKLLPFIMLVWAMTGAFYPAIDLVAGEKERGTLETLLCSPALRSEIVWGKLGAVTTFSILTALLNAASMLLTSGFVFKQIGVGGASGAFGAPPLAPMMWLFVALVPLSALFSALALAVAAMARSSKEGQYYLMPLMMVTLPLVMLPMLPGTTLNVGTSLIPVTGMFLLVRALVEGQYSTALVYVPLVATITYLCLSMAVRWARRQFENESVLFGGGEQWELGMWVRHLWRDRQTAATPAQAYACGAIVLVTMFFARLMVTEMPQGFAGIAKLVLMPQVLIVFPAILMATMMTTSIRKSLRIHMPHWTTLPLAVLLGITLHPTYVMLAKFISHLYPVSEQTAAAMKPFAEQISSAPWLSVVLLMAAVPAICEELAFRGFVFGGLVRERGKLRAVVVTAVMFGISHGVLQQSIAATIMGLMLGWVALKTGSVLPGILIHFTNNALSVSMERIMASDWGGATLFLKSTEAGATYHPIWIVTSIGIAVTCLLYFGTLRPAVDEKDADLIKEHQDFIDPSTALSVS